MGARIRDMTGINLEDFGMTDDDFYEGEELEARLRAGMRAVLGIPAADDEERATRKDIYDRNAPRHGSR